MPTQAYASAVLIFATHAKIEIFGYLLWIILTHNCKKVNVLIPNLNNISKGSSQTWY